MLGLSGTPVLPRIRVIETTVIERIGKDGKPYLVKVVAERGEELIEPSLSGANESKDSRGLK